MTRENGFHDRACCCRRCEPNYGHSRRDFLKSISAFGAATAAGIGLLQARSVAAQTAQLPSGTGNAGMRYVIRGGAVLSMDAAVGDFAAADVLVEGKKIVAIAPSIDVRDAAVIEAKGSIVMPGFID